MSDGTETKRVQGVRGTTLRKKEVQEGDKGSYRGQYGDDDLSSNADQNGDIVT